MFRDLIPVRCGKSTWFGMFRDLIPVRCGKSTGFRMFRDLISVRCGKSTGFRGHKSFIVLGTALPHVVRELVVHSAPPKKKMSGHLDSP
jgi:hypothetical protein